MLEAVLSATGELGYQHTTIEDVIERAGTSRPIFYQHFKDKEDCFVEAYGNLSGWVYARLAAAARRQPKPREALGAAIAEALRMCANQPAFARALIVEPLMAGGQVRQEHDSLLNRLSEGLDRARGDLPPGMTPPPSTSAFMIGAIATLLRERLMAGDGDRVPQVLPGLLHLLTLLYLGEEPSVDEVAAAQS